MATETVGGGVTFGRTSFGTSPGSLRELFEIAVCDVAGPGAYLRMISGRVEQKAAELQAFANFLPVTFSGPTPIFINDLDKATASDGFKKLNQRLGRQGLQADFFRDSQLVQPCPFLALSIGIK